MVYTSVPWPFLFSEGAGPTWLGCSKVRYVLSVSRTTTNKENQCYIYQCLRDWNLADLVVDSNKAWNFGLVQIVSKPLQCICHFWSILYNATSQFLFRNLADSQMADQVHKKYNTVTFLTTITLYIAMTHRYSSGFSSEKNQYCGTLQLLHHNYAMITSLFHYV